jgi:hypothetical protein
VLQAKLTVNRTGDAYELEADRIADWVTASPGDAAFDRAAPRLSWYAPSADGQLPAAPGSVADALSGSGLPLQPGLRRRMEQRFDCDFSRVRVHADTTAERSAEDVGAHAYTVANHIVFGAGQFAPSTPRGERLIAHELAHVMQQSGHAALQRDDKQSAKDFVMHSNAMDLLESKLLQLYEVIPRQDRIKLKTDGTIAIGMITMKGDVATKEPRLVYTTAGFVPSKAFRRAADRLALFSWDGDVGVAAPREGPSRYYSPAGGPPPGTGGLEHAEQLMTSVAEDHEDVVHGMVVSRRLCNDCPLVVRGQKGGRIMVSVVPDPDTSLPNPRRQPRPAKTPAKPAEPSVKPKPAEVTPEARTTQEAQVTQEARVTPDVRVAPEARVTERVGMPLEPIAEAPMADAAKGGVEGAFVMLLGAQLSSVRSAEMDKAMKALAALGPEITRNNERGLDVTVTLVVEVPDQPDVAAYATGVGDPDQVVIFKKMYISNLSRSRDAEPLTPLPDALPTMREGPPGSGELDEPLTLTQQIRSQMGDKYPVPGTGPRKGRHFVSSELHLPAHIAPKKPPAPAKPDPRLLRSLVGSWVPEFRQVFIGEVAPVLPLIGRRLKVEQSPSGELVPRLTLGTKTYAYEPYAPSSGAPIAGIFKLGPGRPPESQWISSRMVYHPEVDVFLEWAKGLDSTKEVIWDALFMWRRA